MSTQPSAPQALARLTPSTNSIRSAPTPGRKPTALLFFIAHERPCQPVRRPRSPSPTWLNVARAAALASSAATAEVGDTAEPAGSDVLASVGEVGDTTVAVIGGFSVPVTPVSLSSGSRRRRPPPPLPLPSRRG